MPEHTSLTEDVCAKWIEELGIYLPGKCGDPPWYHETFYGAYQGKRYYKSSPDVKT